VRNSCVSPEGGDIERAWHVGARHPWRGSEIVPRRLGPFIRRADATQAVRELVVGQWGLIPWFAKKATLAYSTNNARGEELAQKADFRDPWEYGKRCVIPALSFDESCRETGRNVWRRFRRADGEP